MSNFSKSALLQASILALGSLAFSQSALAQTSDPATDTAVPVETTPTTTNQNRRKKEVDEIVVTGSHIKRDTYSSIAPLQVIDFDDQADVGIIDPVVILQTSEAAAGTQIDSAFGGFVTDNGPGSETINLRGLGASRTLVMINGRRMAPAGVEGAPSQPSINMIPSSLVDNIDLLLDGASTVYGSDAIAGVVNVLLKKDVEGFNVQGSLDLAEQGGGNDWNVAGSWGKIGDRGQITVGAEYDFRDNVQLKDRDFFSGCDTHYEVDENGRIRTLDIGDQTRFNAWFGDDFNAATPSECKADGIASRLFESSGTFGSIYGGTGTTNIGIPGYVDQSLASVPIDADGDGRQDYGFQQFSINGNDLETDIISEQKRFNLMAFGEYTMSGEAAITPYFELLYSQVDNKSDQGTYQLFPDVGASNPFNPCGINGADCGSNSFNFDDAFVQRWNTYYRLYDPNLDGDTRDANICATFFARTDADGNPILGTAPFDNARCTPFLFGYGPNDFVGPVDTTPIVGVNGDRSNYETSIGQVRFSGGFKGNIPALNQFEHFNDWTFDASFMHSKSKGESHRPGIREDRLNYALGNDIRTGNPIPGLAPCTTAPGTSVTPDVSTGCVPVNLFASSLYEGVAGDFATSAERDYLFDSRDFDTQYDQTVVNALATGSIGSTQAGPINFVVGAEYRKDKINSKPDEIARDGLFFGFFSDAGAKGDTSVVSAYGEMDIPILADRPGFTELDLNLSGRILNDEYYGTESVYSLKGAWRPVDSLLLRGTYGTSFRSPNLRELFLRPQTGFLRLFDPCAVPSEAIVTPPGGGDDFYDRTQDNRDQDTLDRCIADGLDPTSLGGGGSGIYSTEVFSEGNLDLDPEESRSYTFGFSFEQPFTDRFDLTFGINYYDVKVKNTVITPSAQFIINDCYVNEREGRSPFCDRIGRDSMDELDAVGIGFINLNEDKVRGLDYNAKLGFDLTMFKRNFDLDFNLTANNLLEAKTLFINDDGSRAEDTDHGEFGYADWTGNLRSSITYNNWRFSWFTRYISDVNQDVDGLDDYGNALGIDTDDDGRADAFSDTCGGPAVGDVNCRDVGFADDYWVNNIGLRYNNEDHDWSVRFAINNVFNQDPPKVDSSEVTAISNTPIGAAYDLNGRKYFIQFTKGF